MIPSAPVHIIAPPWPPVVLTPNEFSYITLPKAELFVKLALRIVPCWPNQNTAPPDLLAMLLVNVAFSKVQSWAPLYQSTAPPLTPAKLSVNSTLEIVILLQLPSVLPCMKIAPPLTLASFSTKVQLSIWPSLPVHMTAPPWPPVVLTPNEFSYITLPKAELLINVECNISPAVPNQNIAPPDLKAVLFSNTAYFTWPFWAPLCQSIAPPLTPAVLFMK